MWAAPLGPKKGLRTSHAAVKHVFFSAGWAEELSMELIADRRAPHRGDAFFHASHFVSFFIEETESQCLQHSQTGIVRGAPSKSDDETEASPFQGIAYQFTRSEGGGFHRIPFVGRNQWQSADGSHFYECGIAVSGDAVTGIARLHQRVVGTDGDTFSVTGCKQDVEHAFSTVGHGEHDGPAFGTCGMYPLGGSFSGFCRGETSFKGIKGNHYLFHKCGLL